MDATPVNLQEALAAGGAVPPSALPQFQRHPVHAMDQKWQALHEAAAAVATLAGVAIGPMTTTQRGFPEAMRDVGGWRFTMAQQGVDDLAAIMEPGLAALLAAHASGADAPAAARALWEEFQSARDALMGLTQV